MLIPKCEIGIVVNETVGGGDFHTNKYIRIEEVCHRRHLFVGYNVALFRDVDAIQELPDILILDSGRLLDQCCGLTDGLDGVSSQDQFVFLLLGVFALDTIVHSDAARIFLAQKVTDFDQGAAFGNGAVDGKVSVHGPHLVLVALKITALEIEGSMNYELGLTLVTPLKRLVM